MKRESLKNWNGTLAVIGLDFGDSGKGRLIDDLSLQADIVARYSGGSNTGHTVVNKFGKFALHIIPSGIFNQKALCIIGRGVACDLESLIEDEMVQLKKAQVSWKNLRIDEQATLTMPWHKLRDGLRENYRQLQIGTTKKGVGPTYADRVERSALRVADLLSRNFKEKLADEINFQNKFFKLKLSFAQIFEKYLEYTEVIKPFISQTIPIIKQAAASGKNILFEGTQGWFLDIDSGTYPYVTSTNTGALGIWRSFDLHPTMINKVIGITKAYLTRVGAGPLPTKLADPQRKIIIEKGREIGTTSGRTRDPGWLDLVLLKAAVDANKVTDLAVTKADILSGFKEIKVCIAYQLGNKKVDYLSGNSDFMQKVKPIYKTLPGWDEDISGIREFGRLPQNAKNFIRKIEEYLKVKVSFISVGPKRGQVIYV